MVKAVVDHRWVLILGIFLDMVGTVLIALSVLLLRNKIGNDFTLEALEKDLQNQLDFEWTLTLYGLIFILVGFLFILSDAVAHTFFEKYLCET